MEKILYGLFFVLICWGSPVYGMKLDGLCKSVYRTGAVTGSLSGNNYPGATVPFGMVQLSPDTRVAPDWAQASGYDYNDNTIIGFSHTRLSGTGASDFNSNSVDAYGK